MVGVDALFVFLFPSSDIYRVHPPALNTEGRRF